MELYEYAGNVDERRPMKRKLGRLLAVILATSSVHGWAAEGPDVARSNVDAQEKIAYVNTQGAGASWRHRLLIADSTGGNAKVVMTSSSPIMSPAWSSDGKRLAVTGYERGKAGIYIYELQTGEMRRIVSVPGINGAPDWSPDDQKFAMTISDGKGNADLALADPQKNVTSLKELQILTHSPTIDTEASWSPDGRSIAFTSDRTGAPQIWLLTLGDAEPRLLTKQGKQNLRPRFSPDGQSIAHVQGSGGSFSIALTDIASGATRELTNGPRDTGPSFSPSGKSIIYIEDRHLAVVTIDGLDHRLLSSGEDAQEPAWSPASVADDTR